MRFRKKPVVIKAVQMVPGVPTPEGVCSLGNCGADSFHIHTLEGVMTINPYDWVITGIKGEKYPCKPDIFEATYERVGED